MKDSELVKRIIELVPEDEYRQIISKACSQGFAVPGFSKNKRTNRLDIPVSLVTSSRVLNARNRRAKYNYEIILDAMKSIAIEKNEPEKLLYCVVTWSENIETHEEIENKLVSLKKERLSIKNEDICHSELNKSEIEEKKCEELKEKNLKLEKEIEKLREKARKNKEELQYNKIQISDLKQLNTKLEKEYEKLNNENIELRKAFQSCMVEYEKKTKELHNQIDDLQQYKAMAPKILCFAKNPSKIEISGYDICFLSCIDEQVKEIIKGDYDEIWYVRKGFNHANLLFIKGLIPEVKIMQARDEKDLIDKIIGGRK